MWADDQSAGASEGIGTLLEGESSRGDVCKEGFDQCILEKMLFVFMAVFFFLSVQWSWLEFV